MKKQPTKARAKRKARTKREARRDYSETWLGDAGNCKWPVSFDWHNGYIGINQDVDDQCGRILISPRQASELVKWIQRGRKDKAKGKARK